MFKLEIESDEEDDAESDAVAPLLVCARASLKEAQLIFPPQ